jgi:hypothetical protein
MAGKMKFLIVGCIVLLLLASAMGVGYAADKGIPIDEKHFPDPVFRDIVLTRCDVDYDGYLSNNEITRKVNMNLDNLPAKQVTSLQGIEYFTELKTIYTSLNLHRLYPRHIVMTTVRDHHTMSAITSSMSS